MPLPILYLSRDPDYDYLNALEFGRVPDGQPPQCWRPLGRDFAFYRPPRGRRARGFHVERFSEFDPDDPEVEGIWSEPRFSAPLLGLSEATAGEIIVAARAHFGNEPSINRVYFDAGTRMEGEKALNVWRCCLEAGDSMAHFAIGYTLYELERYREAYGHLRHYAELAPAAAWNWCWLGRAAAAIGEVAEARKAYRARDRADHGGRRRDRRPGAAGGAARRGSASAPSSLTRPEHTRVRKRQPHPTLHS